MAARSVCWLRSAWSAWARRVGRNSMVVAAAFADRLVRAVSRNGSLAPAVGEHPAVLAGELLEALLWVGGRVERVDLR